jgi:hypothetical protein
MVMTQFAAAESLIDVELSTESVMGHPARAKACDP